MFLLFRKSTAIKNIIIIWRVLLLSHVIKDQDMADFWLTLVFFFQKSFTNYAVFQAILSHVVKIYLEHQKGHYLN